MYVAACGHNFSEFGGFLEFRAAHQSVQRPAAMQPWSDDLHTRKGGERLHYKVSLTLEATFFSNFWWVLAH